MKAKNAWTDYRKWCFCADIHVFVKK